MNFSKQNPDGCAIEGCQNKARYGYKIGPWNIQNKRRSS